MLQRSPSKRSFRHLSTILIASLTLLCITALATTASAAGTLTLYAGQHQQTVRMLVKAFEKQTGIDVKVRYGEDAELGNQLLREGTQTPADVFFAENSPALLQLQEQHLLGTIDKDTLQQIPARYRSGKGHWIGVVARENVLTYNPKLVKEDELPKSIMGLSDPKWEGKVGIHIDSADIMPLIKAIALTDGKDKALNWLEGMKRNAKLYQHNSGTVAAVNNGDVAIGVSNSYYYYRLREQVGKDKIVSRVYHFSNGDPGGIVNISGAAIMKNAPHPKAAQKFIAYLVSDKAQKMLADSVVDFEYPLRPGVHANPQLKPFDELQPPDISIETLGTNSEPLKLLQEAGLL